MHFKDIGILCNLLNGKRRNMVNFSYTRTKQFLSFISSSLRSSQSISVSFTSLSRLGFRRPSAAKTLAGSSGDDQSGRWPVRIEIQCSGKMKLFPDLMFFFLQFFFWNLVFYIFGFQNFCFSNFFLQNLIRFFFLQFYFNFFFQIFFSEFVFFKKKF